MAVVTVLTTEVYLASVQAVPVAAMDSIDRRGVSDVGTGSSGGCG